MRAVGRACLAVFLAGALTALSPMSPSLEQTTSTTLEAQLAKAGMESAAASSVLRALEGLLGAHGEETDISYDQPYPQLALVTGTSADAGKGCRSVKLSVTMRGAPANPLIVTGIYCRTDAPGEYWWKSDDQAVAGHW